MSKVLLDYEPSTGQLKTSDGMFIVTWPGLKEWTGDGRTKVDDLVKLKDAGFTAEEIVMLVKKEVL